MLDYADGNAEAFKTLYSRYKQSLYQYMLNSCGNEAVAGELFHDVWTKVINARQNYDTQYPSKSQR